MARREILFVSCLAAAGCAHDDVPTRRDDAGMETPREAGQDPEGSQPAEPEAASAASTITLTSVVTGDLTFQLRVAGPEHGEPVVLLHGFPQTSLEWTAQIESLANAGYRVVAPDQRGYSPGARPPAVADYAMPLLVRDVLNIADALGLERFHLIGHDWGASVAWATAFFAPQRLLSIVPLSVPHLDAYTQVANDPSSCQPAASAYVAELVAEGAEAQLLTEDSAGMRRMYTGLPQPRIDAYLKFFDQESALRGPLHWYRANLAPGAPRPTIGKTSVPTLYIWSDGDTALCRDGAELTASFVSGPYRFEVIEGVNHWLPELAAERVNALLLEHLREHAAMPPGP